MRKGKRKTNLLPSSTAAPTSTTLAKSEEPEKSSLPKTTKETTKKRSRTSQTSRKRKQNLPSTSNEVNASNGVNQPSGNDCQATDSGIKVNDSVAEEKNVNLKKNKRKGKKKKMQKPLRDPSEIAPPGEGARDIPTVFKNRICTRYQLRRVIEGNVPPPVQDGNLSRNRDLPITMVLTNAGNSKYGNPIATTVSDEISIQGIPRLINYCVDINIKNKYGESPLHMVINNENVFAVKDVLKSGADVNFKAEWFGDTPLHCAILKKNTNMEIIEILLRFGSDVNLKNTFGETPFSLAVQKNDVTLVRKLLEAGADVNNVDVNGFTPLYLALECDNPEYDLIVELLEHKANINAQNCYMNTPLHVVVKKGTLNTFRKLMQYKPDVNAKDELGQSALHMACNRRDIQIVVIIELLENGAFVNSTTKSGRTALHLAVKRCALTLVKLLLYYKADANIKDTFRETPLHYSIKYTMEENYNGVVKMFIERVFNGFLMGHLDMLPEEEQNLVKNVTQNFANTMTDSEELDLNLIRSQHAIEIFKALLLAGADVNCENAKMSTPLTLATMAGNAHAVRLLINNGVNVNKIGVNGLTALHFVLYAAANKSEIIEALVHAGADINHADIDSSTALMVAVHWVDLPAVRALLHYGADVNAADRIGFTALHYAVSSRVCCGSSIVEYLLQYGSDITHRSRDGSTPISLAAQYSDYSTVCRLLDCGGEVNDADSNRVSPLLKALKRREPSIEIVELLLTRGADVTVRSRFGETPLHLAVTQSADIVSLFLDGRCNINASLELNCNAGVPGDRPLHIACRRDDKNVEVIRALLESGVDINIRNQSSESPLDCAIFTYNFQGVLELMKFEPRIHLACCLGYLSDWERSETRAKCIKCLIMNDFVQHGLLPSDYSSTLDDNLSMLLTHLSDSQNDFNLFRKKCFNEVLKLMNTRLHCFLSAWDCILMRVNWCNPKVIGDKIVDFLVRDKFPTMHDVLIRKLPNSIFIRRASEQVLSAESSNGEKEIVLLRDCTEKIAHYLSKSDSLNFMKSFIKK